jgi:uncharacterized membrane protein HdeD (DUF308 family)
MVVVIIAVGAAVRIATVSFVGGVVLMATPVLFARVVTIALGVVTYASGINTIVTNI